MWKRCARFHIQARLGQDNANHSNVHVHNDDDNNNKCWEWIESKTKCPSSERMIIVQWTRLFNAKRHIHTRDTSIAWHGMAALCFWAIPHQHDDNMFHDDMHILHFIFSLSPVVIIIYLPHSEFIIIMDILEHAYKYDTYWVMVIISFCIRYLLHVCKRIDSANDRHSGYLGKH